MTKLVELALLAAIFHSAISANYCRIGECWDCELVGGGADKSCEDCLHGIKTPVPGSTTQAFECITTATPQNCMFKNGVYCDKCKLGYYMAVENGPCVEVTQKITNCLEYKDRDQLCLVCDKGYYPADDKRSCIAVTSPVPNCEYYSTATSCLICKQGWKWVFSCVEETTHVGCNVHSGLCNSCRYQDGYWSIDYDNTKGNTCVRQLYLDKTTAPGSSAVGTGSIVVFSGVVFVISLLMSV